MKRAPLAKPHGADPLYAFTARAVAQISDALDMTGDIGTQAERIDWMSQARYNSHIDGASP